MGPGIQQMASAMMAPAVPTHLIYSEATPTLAKSVYDSEDLNAKPNLKLSEYQPGDDTIVASTVEALGHAWREQGFDAHLHSVPGKVAHKELISCDFTVELVSKLLAGVTVADDEGPDETEALLKGSRMWSTDSCQSAGGDGCQSFFSRCGGA